jgi:hypothetical protein
MTEHEDSPKQPPTEPTEPEEPSAELPPPIAGSMSGATREAAQNREATQAPAKAFWRRWFRRG